MWLAIENDDRFKPYLPKGGMAEAARIVVERLEREPIRRDGPDMIAGFLVIVRKPLEAHRHPAAALDGTSERADPLERLDEAVNDGPSLPV